MTYRRVIPRDLFNEGNLLKCYGQLYLELEKMGLQDNLVQKYEGEPFQIEQDQADGSLTVENVALFVRGRGYSFKRPLNSREPYPLYLMTNDDEDYEFRVFDDSGKFSAEMKAFLQGK